LRSNKGNIDDRNITYKTLILMLNSFFQFTTFNLWK